MKKTHRTRWLLATAVVAASIVVLSGCNDNQRSAEIDPNPASAEKLILNPLQKIISSEELILELGNNLGPLNRSARNLRLPAGEATSLFADQIQLTDLDSGSSTQPINEYLSADHWQIAKTVDYATQNEKGFWAAFFDKVHFLESAKFYFISGELDSSGRRFDSEMGFAGHLRLTDGQFAFARAKMSVRWNVEPGGAVRPRIVAWKTKEFYCVRSARPLFAEVTSGVIDDPELATELAESEHEKLTKQLILGEPVKCPEDDKYQIFFSEVTLEHPAVSIVDVDSDGRDDFFLSRIHEPSLLFRSLGDGRFEEVGGQLGMRFEYDCTCSLFADFDNDGDPDAFVGRARHRAVYMQNHDGKYVDRSDLITDVEMPFMVSAISAADYNRDGLLDVYFSTYSPIEGSHVMLLSKGERWPKFFLNTIEQVDYAEKISRASAYLDMVGPPNLLLTNRGGEFAFSDHSVDVESWRKSFQSSWCDFDQDGDQDLYVCNDFAPDDLYRNDGEQGFTRISDEVGLDRLGFGMGVSWNDHDNDGDFDLYVSNMYSKAGTRITRQIDGLDPRLAQMADGNYLYEYDGKKFDLVSLKGPDSVVAKTGWSWGGQFTDFDNDGQADIVVANGYYSAPKDVEIKIDL